MTGQLATDLYMARTLLHQVARDDQASVPFGPPDDTATIIRRARLSRAASVAATVVEGAYGISGTTGLFESCPLQRRLRDVRAVTQHYMLSARSAYGPVGSAILSEDAAG
jgi:alkylation response protein AidB-like acyl-CoA dehydrogenase